MAKKKNKKEQQELLDRARELQAEFWDALSDLECAVEFDIDGTQELPDEIDDLEESEA